MAKEKISLSMATYLTLSRLVIGPLFLMFYVYSSVFHISWVAVPYILGGLLLVSELSDLLDGWLARRYNQVTDLGKILDPMCDSVFRISVFLTFTLPPVQVPLLVVFVFFYRDALISLLRTVCALRGIALAARRSGKIKAVVQGSVAGIVVVLLIPYSLGALSETALQIASSWIVGLAALYTALSAIDYFGANWHHLNRLVSSSGGS